MPSSYRTIKHTFLEIDDYPKVINIYFRKS